MNLWGEEVKPKRSQAKTEQQTIKEPSKQSDNTKYGSDPVTENSTAQHMAARIEFTYGVSLQCLHQSGDNMRNLQFQEKKRLELEEELSKMEKRFDTFITAHNQDISIIKDGLAAIMTVSVMDDDASVELVDHD